MSGPLSKPRNRVEPVLREPQTAAGLKGDEPGRSSRPAAQRATALIVDRDATSRRFAELSLGRVGFAVETARDAASALETLRSDLVDLIICETDLDDMDGLTFFRRLRDEHRLRSIPFMFLSADRSVGARVAALRAGADDYLFKPCDVAELNARAEALVARQKQMREALCARSFSLAGELTVIPFVDLIALLEMTRRSGTLSLVTPNISGRLHFDQGRVVHAYCGNLLGPEAFFRLFQEGTGHFEFANGTAPSEEQTIDGSATALILEAARLSDTAARNRPAHAPEAPRVTAELRPRPTLRPSLPPTDTFAARLEMALEHKFALGDLSLWTAESLAEWTHSEAGGDRFHVHVVADLSAGVSMLLPLGGSPSERWVLESMRSAHKSFGVVFSLRRGATLDVVLLDAADPAANLGSLGRAPSLMIVCPPEGNLVTLGSSARAGLEHLIGAVAPAAILAVGSETLSHDLGEMCAARHHRCKIAGASGETGDARRDLRELLIAGVRLWAGD